MNQHLNLFRYFNESNGSEFIENNLSRAFALCLQHDILFFSHYINAIVDTEDYEYLFNYFEGSNRYIIDLQINTNALELSEIRKVYPVAMTADKDLDLEDFLRLTSTEIKETNYTDVFILIKDIAIVIEVKRNSTDCKIQLFNQIIPFLNAENKIEIIPRNFSWKHTMIIMEQVSNIEKLNGIKSGLISDFLSLSEIRYPYWFSSKPFFLLPALSDHTPKSIHARNLRLKQIINGSSQEILSYSDRMAIGVTFPWASEIIPYFQNLENTDYIVFTIWPGNTKQQGHNVYTRVSQDWVNKKSLDVGGMQCELDVEFHMKFSHFNKYITAINFTAEDLVSAINTPLNYFHKSGKWDIHRWHEFEEFMDDHFKPEFDWKAKCGYESHFVNTERSYFTVSFGYEVDLFVPYKEFQKMDKTINDYKTPSAFIDNLVVAYSTLLD